MAVFLLPGTFSWDASISWFRFCDAYILGLDTSFIILSSRVFSFRTYIQEIFKVDCRPLRLAYFVVLASSVDLNYVLYASRCYVTLLCVFSLDRHSEPNSCLNEHGRASDGTHDLNNVDQDLENHMMKMNI